MEDAVGRDSIESSSTGDEFVVVNGEPKLRITGDFNDLSGGVSSTLTNKMASSPGGSSPEGVGNVIPSSQSVDALIAEGSSLMNESIPSETTPTSESGSMEGSQSRSRSTSLPSMAAADQCTLFSGVTYLGCATVNAPRSEMEICRNMAILNQQSKSSIPIVLAIPATSEGIVRLLDPRCNSEIASYRIHRILFCARGPADSQEKRCFAFTCSHGETAETSIFQCHVFQCDLPEAVPKILYCFATTFRRVPRNSRSSSGGMVAVPEQDFVFQVGLEIKEDDGKGNFSTCPKDKNYFKLRCNVEKRLAITVQQTGPHELRIERCFGLLVSPGRNVSHSDMQLIELVNMGYQGEGKVYSITGHWDPTEKCFEVLNTETAKDTRVFLTVAVDLVMVGIQEPVRFAMEIRAKIYPQSERFWYFTKKVHSDQFTLHLKQLEDQEAGQAVYEVLGVESQAKKESKAGGLSLALTQHAALPEPVQTPQDGDDESDGDEPLLSGSGAVSKEITDEILIEAWHDVLTRWHANLTQRPRQATSLVRKGIPEALRGEVWQLLAGCQEEHELLEAYRILITKDSPNEAVILRDINRTFPAHEFFKENGGQGQDTLYKVCKAYSVYDEEIGYVQGLSFLIAALLLHMPEEQAFCVLVKIMFDLGLRNLFKKGLELLHLRFFQLERLMQDQMPDLFGHFVEMSLEVHMFASQWFLTLFTAKFPLHVVFRILDLYLGEGEDTIFKVALALLKNSRKDLLALDFEGVLKYFRVQLPKKYRTEEAARDLMAIIVSTKVTNKKLKKYEKEYWLLKEREMQQEDPVEMYEREKKRLLEANMRLERENDDLAHELVESRLALRSELDAMEDNCEVLNKDIVVTKKLLADTEEEKKRLELEAAQLKEMCRRELDRYETDAARNTTIIAEYKQICSQLSQRLEKQQTANREELQRIRGLVAECPQCSALFDGEGRPSLPESRLAPEDVNPRILALEQQTRELELELAQTKLALVESECKTQDLTHQLAAALHELQASKNTWFNKTINSLREVTSVKKDPKE